MVADMEVRLQKIAGWQPALRGWEWNHGIAKTRLSSTARPVRRMRPIVAVCLRHFNSTNSLVRNGIVRMTR